MEKMFFNVKCCQFNMGKNDTEKMFFNVKCCHWSRTERETERETEKQRNVKRLLDDYHNTKILQAN